MHNHLGSSCTHMEWGSRLNEEEEASELAIWYTVGPHVVVDLVECLLSDSYLGEGMAVAGP